MKTSVRDSNSTRALATRSPCEPGTTRARWRGSTSERCATGNRWLGRWPSLGDEDIASVGDEVDARAELKDVGGTTQHVGLHLRTADTDFEARRGTAETFVRDDAQSRRHDDDVHVLGAQQRVEGLHARRDLPTDLDVAAEKRHVVTGAHDTHATRDADELRDEFSRRLRIELGP